MIRGTAVVTGVERLSPSFVRVELGGSDLADFGVDGPTYDQRIKLLFGPERDLVRTYTVRAVRPGPRLVVDFVLHLAPGSTGPATLWAAGARPGDEVGIIAPRRGEPFGGIEFAPAPGARLLLAADETAVPAVAAILEQLAQGSPETRGTAYLEVPGPGDVLDLAAPSGVEVRWLPREGSGRAHGSLLDAAVRGSSVLSGLSRLRRAPLAVGAEVGAGDGAIGSESVDPHLWETPTYSSSGEPVDPVGPDAARADAADLYAWIAGEAATVTGLRRHLVRGLGLDRRQVAFMGYWRKGRPHG